MESAVAKRLINTDDYYKMAEVGMIKPDERVELINGEIYTMCPGGSKHAAISQRLDRLCLRGFGDDYSIRMQLPLNIDELNEPEPDIAIVKYRSDDYMSAHPSPSEVYLLIEVSESSYSFDREIKLSLYAENQIPEYWIVNLKKKRVEIYKDPHGGTYQMRTDYLPEENITFMDQLFSVSEILIL